MFGQWISEMCLWTEWRHVGDLLSISFSAASSLADFPALSRVVRVKVYVIEEPFSTLWIRHFLHIDAPSRFKVGT